MFFEDLKGLMSEKWNYVRYYTSIYIYRLFEQINQQTTTESWSDLPF